MSVASCKHGVGAFQPCRECDDETDKAEYNEAQKERDERSAMRKSEGRQGGMMDVIDELIAYCEAWEPWARVMGNVCAGDAAQALRSLRAELAACREEASRYLKALYNIIDAWDGNDDSMGSDPAEIARAALSPARKGEGEGR